MKGIVFCGIEDDLASVESCEKKALGCEYLCRFGGWKVSDRVKEHEEETFGKGVREMVEQLVGDSWVPVSEVEFYGYFHKGEYVLAPDYEGGFYYAKRT